MALLKIRTFPDPILRQPAKRVETFDDALEKLVADMLETMYDAPGVGLAANQIGELKRVVVIDVDFGVEGSEEDGVRELVNKNPRILVNPELVKKSGEVFSKEGCLSVPGFSEEVKRHSEVAVRYQDLKGQTQTIEGHELLATCLQHEIDHLDGKLFIDRLSMVKRSLIKGKIKKERGNKFERSKFHVEL